MPELLRDMIERVSAAGGDAPAISVPGATLRYGDLDPLADRAATMLAGLGCAEGDVVMARCANGVSMLATWLGCIKLGTVFMPVNSLLTGAPLQGVMAHAGGRVAVVDAALLPPVLAVREALPDLRHLVVAGGPAPPGALAFEPLLEAAPALPPPPLRSGGEAPARLMYTSGTTGRPKGAVWSRIAEAHHAQCYGDELVRVDRGEPVYACLPLFHATCQGTTLGTLWRGGHMHIDPTFEPFRFWSRIRETGAVFFPYVGTLLSVVAKRAPRPDDADNPVRRIMGSAAPAERWREIEERFGLFIDDVWGQTELASCWTLPQSVPARPGTVGQPAPRFEARLAGDGGGEPAPGAVAEMWIRPLVPHVVFEGYFRDEGGTAGMWTEDGWYRTGDLMRREPDGDYVFSGRLRDAIRRRGEMISPASIEEAALRCAGVLEAAAVGVPAPHGVEEEIKLCVVLQPGSTVATRELHRALAATLPAFMVPRYIQAYAEFPKTPTTRIQKYRLQADGVAGAWDSRRPTA